MPKRPKIEISYDATVDAAYIDFGTRTQAGGRTIMVQMEKPEPGPYQVGVDLDPQGHIVGIEVLHATKWLTKRLLDAHA